MSEVCYFMIFSSVNREIEWRTFISKLSLLAYK